VKPWLSGERAPAKIFAMGAVAMPDWQPSPYKDYRWIVADRGQLGGKLTVRRTRLAVSLILECLADGICLDALEAAADCSHRWPIGSIGHEASCRQP
jgi:hypothetical protein